MYIRSENNWVELFQVPGPRDPIAFGTANVLRDDFHLLKTIFGFPLISKVIHHWGLKQMDDCKCLVLFLSLLSKKAMKPHGRVPKEYDYGLTSRLPPSEHPNPTTKIKPKMGGEFTYQPKWDPKRVLTTTATSNFLFSRVPKPTPKQPMGGSLTWQDPLPWTLRMCQASWLPGRSLQAEVAEAQLAGR